MPNQFSRLAFSLAILALLNGYRIGSLHAQTAAQKTSGTTTAPTPMPFVDCGHPFDAENPSTDKSKLCMNTIAPVNGGNGGDQDPNTSDTSWQDSEREQCSLLGITKQKACKALPKGKAQTQCTKQVNQFVNSCITSVSLGGPVEGNLTPPPSTSTDTTQATAAPQSTTATQSTAVSQANLACSSQYKQNYNYCKTLKDSNTAAECRALTSSTFQSCMK